MSESSNEITGDQVAVPPPKGYKYQILALGALFVIYVALLYAGVPQKWTQAQFAHHDGEGVETIEVVSVENAVIDAAEVDTQSKDNLEKLAENVQTEEAEHTAANEAHYPPLWTSLPFAGLLLCIALLPLIPATEHWWESNLNKFIVAAVLAFITMGYYAFCYQYPLDVHWPAHQVVPTDASWFFKAGTIFVNAIFGEYISFIVLLFALFVITGGIRISGDLLATPLVNTTILAVGALMASCVGTTGAAMLLIRLLLETNTQREHKVHTLVFFIFCVCNLGGCLLPIGDPPLFLGYLRGVNFLWTLNLWPQWLFSCGLLLALYFVIDFFFVYPKESELSKQQDRAEKTSLKIRGLFPNLFCLVGVVLAVMLLDPAQEFLALFGVKTGFYPPMFLREIVQLLMVCISLICGSKAIRAENQFNFGAIIEVAALFFGIFICMQAPLQILNAKGADIAASVDKYGSKIGLNEPKEFFWMSGALSSFLDNAPTYVVFFETAKSATEGELQKAKQAGATEEVEKIQADITAAKEQANVPVPLALLIAVSLGSVFMGAMTYIGNGPNFMVKAIAEQSGVKMPSFFGYMAYSCFILLPVLIVMTIVFL